MMPKQLTYKERQDVMWALEEQAKGLEERTEGNVNQARMSADRLRRLHAKYRNGER